MEGWDPVSTPLCIGVTSQQYSRFSGTGHRFWNAQLLKAARARWIGLLAFMYLVFNVLAFQGP
jgi:hypothetical protein